MQRCTIRNAVDKFRGKNKGGEKIDDKGGGKARGEIKVDRGKSRVEGRLLVGPSIHPYLARRYIGTLVRLSVWNSTFYLHHFSTPSAGPLFVLFSIHPSICLFIHFTLVLSVGLFHLLLLPHSPNV